LQRASWQSSKSEVLHSSAVDEPVNDINFSKRSSADPGKAEQLKDTILDSLKLNDEPISKSYRGITATTCRKTVTHKVAS